MHRLGLLLPLLFLGCSSSSSDAEPSPTPANDPAATTWYRDVLPVAQEHCLACHNDEAPTFSMSQWSEDLAARAALIAQYTADGVMPPWQPSADCNSYHGENILDDEAIAVFAAWADAGGAEGDIADAPPPLQETPGLASVDRTVGMGASYTPEPPAGDPNELRCFVMDPETDGDVILAGYDVHPGEPKVVHHVLLYAASGSELDALDAADPGLGYDCPGGPQASSARAVAGWVPGMPANNYPAGTGMPLSADEKLVMQIHYNTSQSGALPDNTQIDLQLADEVDAPAQMLSMADHGFAIPPHTDGYTTVVETVAPADGTIWAAAPHMHLLGQQTRIEVERAGGDTACLVDIPKWDFDWQGLYFLSDAKGMPVSAGDTIRFSCTWDNTLSKTVTWGDGTEDEMCIAYLYVTAGHVN